MRAVGGVLAACATLIAAGGAFAQATPPAEARRLIDDLLAETKPSFFRDGGALNTRPNRMLVGATRYRPSPVRGVCEMDRFRIVALPERERAPPSGFEKDSALIRSVESERLYEFAFEDLRALDSPDPHPEATCANLWDTNNFNFFPAPNAGAARAAGDLLMWLAADPAGRMPRRCGAGACPTAAETKRLLRRGTISSVHEHETCHRPEGLCYTVLLHDDDNLWSIDAWRAFGKDDYAFKDIRVRRQANLVMD